jgi:hypothetical protein
MLVASSGRKLAPRSLGGGLRGGFVTAFVFAILCSTEPERRPIVADSIFRDRWAALAQIRRGLRARGVLIAYSSRCARRASPKYYVLLAAAAPEWRSSCRPRT